MYALFRPFMKRKWIIGVLLVAGGISDWVIDYELGPGMSFQILVFVRYISNKTPRSLLSNIELSPNSSISILTFVLTISIEGSFLSFENRGVSIEAQDLSGSCWKL